MKAIVCGIRRFRDRCKEGRLIQLLQCTKTPAEIGGSATNRYYGCTIEKRAGDGSEKVGDTGTSSCRNESRSAGESCGRLSGETRCLFTPGVNEFGRVWPFLTGVIKWKNMGTRECEEMLNPVLFGCGDHLVTCCG